MFWKAQKRSFKQFGGGRFLESRISKSEKFPPCCVPIDNKGGKFFTELSWYVSDLLKEDYEFWSSGYIGANQTNQSSQSLNHIPVLELIGIPIRKTQLVSDIER